MIRKHSGCSLALAEQGTKPGEDLGIGSLELQCELGLARRLHHLVDGAHQMVRSRQGLPADTHIFICWARTASNIVFAPAGQPCQAPWSGPRITREGLFMI